MSQGSSARPAKASSSASSRRAASREWRTRSDQEFPHLVHRLRHLGGEGIGREVRVTDDPRRLVAEGEDLLHQGAVVVAGRVIGLVRCAGDPAPVDGLAQLPVVRVGDHGHVGGLVELEFPAWFASSAGPLRRRLQHHRRHAAHPRRVGDVQRPGGGRVEHVLLEVRLCRGEFLHDRLEAGLLVRRQVHAGQAEVADRQLEQAAGAFARTAPLPVRRGACRARRAAGCGPSPSRTGRWRAGRRCTRRAAPASWPRTAGAGPGDQTRCSRSLSRSMGSTAASNPSSCWSAAASSCSSSARLASSVASTACSTCSGRMRSKAGRPEAGEERVVLHREMLTEKPSAAHTTALLHSGPCHDHLSQQGPQHDRAVRPHHHRRRQRRPRRRPARGGVRRHRGAHRARAARRHLRERGLRAEEDHLQRRQPGPRAGRRPGLRLRSDGAGPRLGGLRGQADGLRAAAERHLRAEPGEEGHHPHRGPGPLHRPAHRRGRRPGAVRQAHRRGHGRAAVGAADSRRTNWATCPTTSSASRPGPSGWPSWARVTSPSSSAARCARWAPR